LPSTALSNLSRCLLIELTIVFETTEGLSGLKKEASSFFTGDY
jgi:hypothetical protein